MTRTINIYKIGELIGENGYRANWHNYTLGPGWGSVIYADKHIHSSNGAILQGIHKDTTIQEVMQAVYDGDFDKVAGFYPAILFFFGERFIDRVDFCDNNNRNRISRLIDALKAPKQYEEEIREFVKRDFDFVTFLEACSRNEKLNFDLNSAITVYKLQGDAAIYSILCQVFYVNGRCDNSSISLCYDVPVTLPIEVSNFVSGCHFPVAVSPAVSDFKWDVNQNGHFLYGLLDGEWLCVDVVGVGFVNLSNYLLANRLNFLGGGGECLPYVICWNWGEVIEAYHHFGRSLLIRDLRNTIFNHYWFNFGLESYINVKYFHYFINGDEKYTVETKIYNEPEMPQYSPSFLTLQLDGKFIEFCDKDDVCFSPSEIHDWFEIASFLK